METPPPIVLTPMPSADAAETPPADAADLQLLAAIQACEHGTRATKKSGTATLLITCALFLAAGGLSWGLDAVVMLAIAIAIHELGHVLAMRVFGYKNVRMLFVPFFGGLATGVPTELDATKNVLVALAGPLVGLLSAMIVGVLGIFLGAPAWIGEFAWISVGLNAFNLLPLVPLDGGQITNDTLFSRYPVLETGFRLIAVVGLGWLAWDTQSWVLAVLPAFLLISLPFAHRRACVVRDARRDVAWQSRELDVETARALRGLVAKLFSQVKPEQYTRALPEHAHTLWMEIRKRFPGPGRTIALLAGYLVVAVILFPAIAFFLSVFYGDPTGNSSE